MKKLLTILLALISFQVYSQTWFYAITPIQVVGSNVGANIFSIPNPGAVRFLRINADNSIDTRTAAQMISDLGALVSADLSGYAPLASPTFTGTVVLPNSTVTNAMLAGSIAYSKLSLTGAILNADLAGSIAYSKLSLTGAILNADLAGSITYGKLSLTGAILNADLAGSIAYSKLSLTGAILNADLAGSITAANLVGTDIATVGTITAGTWQGTILSPTYGGTGVNNASRTLTISTNSGTISFTSSVVLTVAATSSISGTNTGDNAVNSLYSGLVSNATHTGDATGATALTVVAINGTTLSGLATGILKNTTTTGVPSIAVAGDFPTLNQSTTGSAATLTTSRNINGTAFNGSADITVTAAGSTLTGSSLASGITSSSLTSFGTSPTLTTPTISTGLTASGSAANTFVSSTGTFITSTGANTLSGAVDINAATTPSLTLNSGKTNTGFVLINGKTSGALKFLPVDAAGQTVTVSLAAQTTGASTLTIPDRAGSSGTFAFTDVATLSSLVSIGTVTTGTWQATVVSSTFGGTGINNAGRTLTISTNSGTIAFGAASKTLTINNSISLTGTDATVMTFPSTTATIARTDALQTFTGVQTFSTAIAIASGGTNNGSLSVTQGSVYYGDGSKLVALAPGTNGQVLQTQGAGANPQWFTVSGTGNSIISADETFSGQKLFNPTKLVVQSTASGGAIYEDITNITPALASTAVKGMIDFDPAAMMYFTHASNERGIVNAEQMITLTAAYTLTSQTAVQKAFNSTTNGQLTVAASKTYFFDCYISLTAMSASSGSFGFALGGTATLTRQAWWTQAIKAALATAGTSQGTFNTAANTTLVTANTTTTGWLRVSGKIVVGTGGTIIPQLSLGVAATAVVGNDSYFRIWPVGTNTVQTVGNWN